jgi:site-specific recombinase XerD
LLDAGLRVSELAGLSRASYDWQQHTITVNGKGGPFGSGTKRRVIPLSTRARDALERFLGAYDRVGMSTRTIQRMVSELARRAQIQAKVTPHVLRHTFAVTCLKKHMNVETIRRLLGHDSLSTTQIYLNMFPEDVIREFRDRW